MFPQLGLPEMLVVMGFAVILFGKRLPEVGRSLGKGIVEFKKGLRGMEDEFDPGSSSASASRHHDDFARPDPTPIESSVPKFEPPTAAPVAQGIYESPPATD